MPLIDTVGGSSSNTYADLAWYKNYLSTRRPLPSWLALALSVGGDLDDELTIDLIQSARLLDSQFIWNGSPVSATQRMAFPRQGLYSRNGVLIPDSVNPDEIKDAQSEYAVILHDKDLLSENEAEQKGVRKVKAGSVEVEFQSRDISGEESISVSITRQGPEFDYLRVPISVRQLIPSDWYKRSSLSSVTGRGFIFEVVG
jgi:hypothetical protein